MGSWASGGGQEGPQGESGESSLRAKRDLGWHRGPFLLDLGGCGVMGVL